MKRPKAARPRQTSAICRKRQWAFVCHACVPLSPRRFYSQGEQIGGQSFYYTRDHLGSVRELVDSAGSLRSRYDYDLWGNRSANLIAGDAAVESQIGFTGHYYHGQSKLALAPFRAYSAETKRWLSRDPIGEDGGLNLYGYVGNNPISLTDPLGLLAPGRFVVDNIHPYMIFPETRSDGTRTGKMLVAEYGPGATSGLHEMANNSRNDDPISANLIQQSLAETSYTSDMVALLWVTQGFLTMGQPHVYEWMGDHLPENVIYVPSTPDADALLMKILQLELNDTDVYSFWMYNSRDWMRDHMYIGCPSHRNLDFRPSF